MSELKCIHCDSNNVRKGGSRKRADGSQTKLYRCQSCGKCFSNNYVHLPAQSAEKKCPKCESSNTVKLGSPIGLNSGRSSQRAKCKDCQKIFMLETVSRIAPRPSHPANVKCPRCEGFNTVRYGDPIQRQHGMVMQCRCKDCKKEFTYGGINTGLKRSAKPAGINCPHCNSSNTFNLGNPIQRKYGLVQQCCCKDCKVKFTPNTRQKREILLEGKLIHKYWDPPGLEYVPDANCPECNQSKVVLRSAYYVTAIQKQNLKMLCLSCGRNFIGEGRAWQPEVLRRLGKEVPRRPWQFKDDLWDLRELYPNIDEYKLKAIFLDFSKFGSEWFKGLVKHHLQWRISSGNSHRTLISHLSGLRKYSRFLERHKITSIKQVDRELMATYWSQELGSLSRHTLHHQMCILKNFLDWGNAEQLFTTSSALITSFDLPKVFYDEPDPLEEKVLDAIRDNLHHLPEPLQLMFMLCFWLGARPGELCSLQKNCLRLDPDGTTWWLEFKRDKSDDEHRLPITTDLVSLVQQQQMYISDLYGEDYQYLFCHYQGIGKTGYPSFSKAKPIRKPPITDATSNPMVKAVRQLIKHCDIRDSNGQLAKFNGKILRPSRASHLIQNGFSLEFVRIWLKHRSAKTTKRHYTRFPPGELLDVACVMANMDAKFYPYDSNPESLRQNPELHELDGLKTLGGEPLYGYCSFKDFCPRFGRCYTCGFHIASSDKLPQYKAQLQQLLTKEELALNYGSSEILNSYQELRGALENIVTALEKTDE